MLKHMGFAKQLWLFFLVTGIGLNLSGNLQCGELPANGDPANGTITYQYFPAPASKPNKTKKAGEIGRKALTISLEVLSVLTTLAVLVFTGIQIHDWYKRRYPAAPPVAARHVAPPAVPPTHITGRGRQLGGGER